MNGSPLDFKFEMPLANRALIFDSTAFWFCEYGADCQSTHQLPFCHFCTVLPIRFAAESVHILVMPVKTVPIFIFSRSMWDWNVVSSVSMFFWCCSPLTYTNFVDRHIITSINVWPLIDCLIGPITSQLQSVPRPFGPVLCGLPEFFVGFLCALPASQHSRFSGTVSPLVSSCSRVGTISSPCMVPVSMVRSSWLSPGWHSIWCTSSRSMIRFAFLDRRFFRRASFALTLGFFDWCLCGSLGLRRLLVGWVSSSSDDSSGICSIDSASRTVDTSGF